MHRGSQCELETANTGCSSAQPGQTRQREYTLPCGTVCVCVRPRMHVRYRMHIRLCKDSPDIWGAVQALCQVCQPVCMCVCVCVTQNIKRVKEVDAGRLRDEYQRLVQVTHTHTHAHTHARAQLCTSTEPKQKEQAPSHTNPEDSQLCTRTEPQDADSELMCVLVRARASSGVCVCVCVSVCVCILGSSRTGRTARSPRYRGSTAGCSGGRGLAGQPCSA